VIAWATAGHPRRRVIGIASALVVVLAVDGVMVGVRARSGDKCVTRYWHFTRQDFIGSTVEVQLHTCLHLDARARTATVTARARALRSGDLNLEPVVRRAYVHVAVIVGGEHQDRTCAYPSLVSTTGLQAEARRRGDGKYGGYGTLKCSVSSPYANGNATAISNPLVDVVDDGFDLLGSPYAFSGK
jgi:hypothetical protein